MPIYKAPLEDMLFVLKELWHIDDHLKQTSAFSEFNTEVISAILEEAAKLAENVFHPINQSGDQQGCQWQDGKVTTPSGFKEAYQTFQQGGWCALVSEPEYGGQGVPHMVGVLVDEMLCSGNISLHLYSNLTAGVSRAISAHASEELKDIYLPNMVSGLWAGAMCLTEPHCGTDLGLIRTKATKQADGAYKLNGTKIFITAGEHDLTENIIHLVLARTEGAPEGIKGLSLFIVPKLFVNEDGSLGRDNGLKCGSIEHKMGIKGSCTCVMNYDDAIGYLVGEEHKGIQGMFTVMNIERLCIGLQGLSQAECSYQNALAYAKERLQSRAPAGAIAPDKAADPIIAQPDVRRMLLWMKSHNEAARAFSVWVGQLIDIAHYADNPEQQQRAAAFVEFFTPVVKTFLSDYGFEACNHGLQILGGHGYICEWGLEQFVRDARIAQIYEGANGIQALDLVKRKLVANKGAYCHLFSEEIHAFMPELKNLNDEGFFHECLSHAIEVLEKVSNWIIEQAEEDPNSVGAASMDYCHMVGIIAFAYMWARMVVVAEEKSHLDFYSAKVKTAIFFYQKVLPQVETLADKIFAGSDCLMAHELQEF